MENIFNNPEVIQLLSSIVMGIFSLILIAFIVPNWKKLWNLLGYWVSQFEKENEDVFNMIVFFLKKGYEYAIKTGEVDNIEQYLDTMAIELDKWLEERGFGFVDVPLIFDRLTEALLSEIEDFVEDVENDSLG